METLSFIILAFTIYSIIASMNTKGKNRTGGRLRFPGENRLPREFPVPREITFPKENPASRESFPPEIRFPQPEPTTNSSTSGRNVDPYKDLELTQAQGHEGDWGDEGRPSGMAYQMETEGGPGVEGSAGTEGSAGIEGSTGTEGSKGTEGTLGTRTIKPALRPTASKAAIAGWNNALTSEDLIRGIILSEVLGKPRAMKPYQGPRKS